MDNNEKNPNYPDGVIVFPARQGAPDYARAKIIINLADFSAYVKENPDMVVEYYDKREKKKKKQIVFDVNKSNKSEGAQESWYCKTNTYQAPLQADDDDDLLDL